MKQTRVLLIAPSEAIVGGQSVQAKRLLSALAAQSGLHVDFQPVNPKLSRLLRELQRVKYVRTVTTEALYLGQVLAKSSVYDVLHVFTAGYSSFLLTLAPVFAAARLTRTPVLVNYHDGRAEDHLRHSRSAVSLLRSVSQIVVPSGYLVDIFAKFGLPARPIHNIVDVSQFLYRDRPEPKPKFLHNRGLEPHYNVECSLRAFQLVQQRYPEASIDIAHDGSMRARLESLTSELELRNVRFLGQVGQEQMRILYNQADIYIMSPRADNMPLSVLECFASGLPVISTAVGGVPYIIENGRTGLLAPDNDARGLADAAIRLITERGLSSTITGSAFKECEKYGADRVACEWQAAYDEVLGGAARRPAPLHPGL